MSSSKTIGIIGGGQLGQMMAISAIYMGHKVIALDPAADCPASRVAEIIVAPYNDVDALRQLAERCDVLTYEFENVDADGLDAVIKDGQLPQGTDLLRISQNRIFEKDFLSNKAQVTVAPYKVVTSSQDLADIDLSKNYVLKTATGGYDGHGQKVICSEADLAEAYTLADSADCVLEEFVNFDLEISVIVSGNGKDVTVFPVQENIHRNNILSKTIVPARISESLAEKAKAMAVRIAEQLRLSGTLCVEMFATADDIIVNEIAPRPHNSGHYSIEACDFSQFDTHILGVLGAPLPAIKLHEPAVMLNVLGQHVEVAEKYVTENISAHLHMYGKIEAKHNRKMGHVTLFSDAPAEVEEFGEGIDFYMVNKTKSERIKNKHNNKKFWIKFFILLILYSLLSFFYPWFNKNIFKDWYGVPFFISILLIYLWYFLLKEKAENGFTKESTGWNEEEIKKFNKFNNHLMSFYLVLNLLGWGVGTVFLENILGYFSISKNEFQIQTFIYFGFLLSSFLFLAMLLIVIPSQRAILLYDKKSLDKFFCLNVWNYYVFKDKKMTNFDLFLKNTSSVTNEEIKLVQKALRTEGIEQLRRFCLCLDSPKFRDSTELSFGIITNKIIKVTGSVSLLGVLYQVCKYIYDNISKNDNETNGILQFLLNSGGTIIILLMLLFSIWFLFSVLFFEMSSLRKRKQVDYIFFKLVKEMIEIKEGNNREELTE